MLYIVEDFGGVLRKPIKVSKWMPDDAAEGCRRCKRAFSLFRRRHHCRYCGDLVCADESRANVVFAVGAKPVRTCDRCLRRIVGRIDALFDRRYTRAALLNSPTKFSTPPLSPVTAAAEEDDDGTMVFEAIDDTGNDGSIDVQTHGDGTVEEPESCAKIANSARSLAELNLREPATSKEQTKEGDNSNGSSRKLTSNADLDEGNLSTPRENWFLKAFTSPFHLSSGVVAGGTKSIAASTTSNLPIENNGKGKSGSGDKEGSDNSGNGGENEQFEGRVERVSSALLEYARKDSAKADDDDVESTDGVDGSNGNDNVASSLLGGLNSGSSNRGRHGSDGMQRLQQIVQGSSPAVVSSSAPALPPLQRSRSLGDVPSLFLSRGLASGAAGQDVNSFAAKVAQERVKSTGS